MYFTDDGLYDLTALHPVDDSFQGTRFDNPAMLHAMANMVADSTPDFFLENIKQMVRHGIQPYFALGHVHGLEIVEPADPQGLLQGADERILQWAPSRAASSLAVRMG